MQQHKLVSSGWIYEIAIYNNQQTISRLMEILPLPELVIHMNQDEQIILSEVRF